MTQILWRRLIFASAAFVTLAVAGPALAQYSEEVEATTEVQHETKLPYRGSIFIYEHYTRPWAYSGEELTYDPLYSHDISLRPRWYFNDHVWARVIFDMEQELTNSDDSTLRNEVRVTGTTLDVNYSGIPLFENAVLNTKLNFGFPTDQVSQLRTMYLSIGPSLALDYTIPSLAKGLTLTFSAGYTKYLNRYADGDVDVSRYCSYSHNTTVECTSSGSMNPSQRLLWSLVGVLQATDALAITADFRIYDVWAYDVPDATVETLTGEDEVERSDLDTRLRAMNRFLFDISYNITKYFAVSIGTDTYIGQLGEDSTYRFPFWNRYTNFYLDLTLMPDELVKALSPARTASNPRPTRTAANDQAGK